jgi:hypothetical protein
VDKGVEAEEEENEVMVGDRGEGTVQKRVEGDGKELKGEDG